MDFIISSLVIKASSITLRRLRELSCCRDVPAAVPFASSFGLTPRAEFEANAECPEICDFSFCKLERTLCWDLANCFFSEPDGKAGPKGT